MSNKCKICKIGNVLPRYRRGRAPIYRCNHCAGEYIPRKHPGGFYETHTDRRIKRALRAERFRLRQQPAKRGFSLFGDRSRLST